MPPGIPGENDQKGQPSMMSHRETRCGQCKLPPIFHAATTHGTRKTLVAKTGTVSHSFVYVGK